MGRYQSQPAWQERNAVLAEMGSKYRIRLTSQSPIYYIRATELFLDGTKVKSTGIDSRESDALNRVFSLCLQLQEDPGALNKTPPVTEELTGWTALTLRLKEHLTRKGTTIHTDYARHIRELSALPGSVSVLTVKRWVLAAPHDSRARLRRVTTERRLFEIGLDIDRDWLARTRAESTLSAQKILDPRDLPRDEQVTIRRQPQRRSVKTAIDLIATYDLRNHEVVRQEWRRDGCGTCWRSGRPCSTPWWPSSRPSKNASPPRGVRGRWRGLTHGGPAHCCPTAQQ